MNRLVFVAATAILIVHGAESLAAAPKVSGQAASPASPKMYIGIHLPYESIHGDFDGISARSSTIDSIYLPSIDPGAGVGLMVGIHPTPPIDLEAALSVITHDSQWRGTPYDVTHQTLGVNGRINFRMTHLVQPHLMAGLALHRLVVTDGSTAGSAVGDAVYTGVGLDLGAGLGGYLTQKVSVGATLVYRLIRYGRAEGVLNSGAVSPGVNGNSGGIVFHTAYHF